MELARSIEVAREWRDAGKLVAVATLVRVRGPAPRPLGSRFLVSSSGDMEGSVSGGCVENDVYLHAGEVLEDGRGRLVGYGISNDAAFEVGLSCGGEIEVFIDLWDDDLWDGIDPEQTVVIATVVDGPASGSRGFFDRGGSTKSGLPPDVAEAIAGRVRAALETGRSSIVDAGESAVFLEAVSPPPRLLIFGAVEIGQALCALAARAGFVVTVCDPRSAFTTPDRFPDAAQIITAWPDEAAQQVGLDEQTFVVVLSHDPRYEDPIVTAALASNVRYLGAMGSRKTHRRRLERLVEAGVPPETLTRIHGPIGVDLGAATAAETAVEILAEVVQARRAESSSSPTGPSSA